MHKSQFIDSTIQKYVDEHSLRLNKAQRQLLDYSLSLRKICTQISLAFFIYKLKMIFFIS